LFSALLFAFRRKIVFLPHHGLKPQFFNTFKSILDICFDL